MFRQDDVQLDILIYLSLSVGVILFIAANVTVLRLLTSVLNKYEMRAKLKGESIDTHEKENVENVVLFQNYLRLLNQKFGQRTAVRLTIEGLIAVLSSASCIIFIYLTIDVTRYSPKASDEDQTNPFIYADFENDIFGRPWVVWVNFFIAVCFFFIYFVDLALASNRISHVFTWNQLTTACFFIPGLFAPWIGVFFYGFQFFSFAHFLRTTNFFRSRGWVFKNTGLISQIQFVLFQLATIIFFAAGFIFIVENNTVNPDGLVLTFLDAIYFIVVSLTTVGYGDISPRSETGKVVVMLMIAVGIATLPISLGTALDLWVRSHDLGHKHFQPSEFSQSPHIVVFGHHPSSLLPFLREFYHPKKDLSSRTVKCCVMLHPALGSPSPELLESLRLEDFSPKIQILMGDPTSHIDLERASLSNATAAFLLCDKFATYIEQEDARIVLETYAIRNYNQSIKLFVQILSPRHRSPLGAANVDTVVSVYGLNIGLMAASVVSPGFSTILTNLSQTWSPPDISGQLSPVEEALLDGYANSLHIIKLTKFARRSFTEAATIIFRKTNACLIGVVVDDIQVQKKRKDWLLKSQMTINEVEKSPVELNPGSEYILEDQVQVIVICKGAAVARQIEELDPTEENDQVTEFRPIYDAQIEGVCPYDVTPALKQGDPDIWERVVERWDEIPSLDHIDFILLIGDFHNYSHNIITMIKKIRDFALKEITPIVILTHHVPKEHEWRRIRYITNVFIVLGYTTDVHDLKRAGVLKAHRIVIFSHGSGRQDASFDAKAVMIYRLLPEIMKKEKEQRDQRRVIFSDDEDEETNLVMVSVVYDQNITYMGNAFEEGSLSHFSKTDPQFNRQFVEGTTFSLSYLDALLAGSFTNGYLIHTFERLFGYVYTLIIEEDLPGFEEKTYGELFCYLAAADVIPIGVQLHRPRGWEPLHHSTPSPTSSQLECSGDSTRTPSSHHNHHNQHNDSTRTASFHHNHTHTDSTRTSDFEEDEQSHHSVNSSQNHSQSHRSQSQPQQPHRHARNLPREGDSAPLGESSAHMDASNHTGDSITSSRLRYARDSVATHANLPDARTHNSRPRVPKDEPLFRYSIPHPHASLVLCAKDQILVLRCPTDHRHPRTESNDNKNRHLHSHSHSRSHSVSPAHSYSHSHSPSNSDSDDSRTWSISHEDHLGHSPPKRGAHNVRVSDSSYTHHQNPRLQASSRAESNGESSSDDSGPIFKLGLRNSLQTGNNNNNLNESEPHLFESPTFSRTSHIHDVFTKRSNDSDQESQPQSRHVRFDSKVNLLDSAKQDSMEMVDISASDTRQRGMLRASSRFGVKSTADLRQSSAGNNVVLRKMPSSGNILRQSRRTGLSLRVQNSDVPVGDFDDEDKSE